MVNCSWAPTWQNQQSDCAPSENSDQPGNPPSLIGVFAVHMKKAWVLSYPLSAQGRLWSDWTDHSFCWFCHVVAQLVSHLALPTGGPIWHHAFRHSMSVPCNFKSTLLGLLYLQYKCHDCIILVPPLHVCTMQFQINHAGFFYICNII